MDQNTQETVQPKKDDSFLALVILVLGIIAAIGVLLYFWKNQKSSSKGKKAQTESFSPPEERAVYIEAKNQSDLGNPSHLDNLKKLLMKRAIKTIPIVLSLQNEGSSIERLYKKGMLTDDMHFKVKEIKNFVDVEFQEIQNEAEELLEGWGQMVWPQAMQFYQMVQNQAEGKPATESHDDHHHDEEDKKKEAAKPKEKSKGKKQSSPGNDEVDAKPLPTSEEAKAAEAERNAQKLLEEEEREKEKQAKKGGKGNKGGKK